MKFDLNDQCYVAESRADFLGWKILAAEPFKPGVRRVHCLNGRDFRLVYASDDCVRPLGMSQSHWRKVSKLPDSARGNFK